MLKKPEGRRALKKPSVYKRPAGRVAGTSKDPRSNGRWLWAAVTVGRGCQVFTRDNGLKRFTFRFLKKKSEATKGKPRGYEEISDTLPMLVHRGSIVVSDKWWSTRKAVRSLGFASPPGINHGVEFRDRATGFHSNDIEAEFQRLKAWPRARYTRLQLTELDLHEYTFYSNMSDSVCKVLEALGSTV